MKVVSLFGGIECGRIALDELGIHVDKYYSSEIDPYAIKVSSKNYPDIIHLGDATKWQDWDLNWEDVDVLLAGFPCQAWSIAGTQGGVLDERGKLLYTMMDILNHIRTKNPNIKFLFENVKMKKEFADLVNETIGVNPIEINSRLLTAQNRPRVYWTNIEGVTIPEDQGIILKDILEGEVDAKYYLSYKAIDYMSRLRNGKERWEYHKNPLNGKAACLTANMYKGVPYGVIRLDKCEQIATLEMKGNDSIRRVYNEEGKSPCLTTSMGGHRQPKVFDYEKESARKLTPLECERLQGLPDSYTEGVSSTQRYKCIGNGWSVPVIKHILKNLK